jgi:hypothetical protein
MERKREAIFSSNGMKKNKKKEFSVVTAETQII